MFEETMGMLPFASRADLYEAMAKVDDEKQSIAKYNKLLAALRAEHDKPGVREQLQNLWIRRIRETSEEEEPSQTSVQASAVGDRLGKAITPPQSPRRGEGAVRASDGGEG